MKSKYIVSIEFNSLFYFELTQIIKKNKNRFKVSIWDVGGQRTLRPFWRNYYEQTDSLIWVVDATDLGRLPDCKKELDKVMTEDRLTGASLLVFVNKLDAIVDDSSLSQNGNRREKIVAEVRNALELDKITKHHWNILGCSAYDGTNLKEGLEWVVEEVKSRLFLLVD